MHGQPELIVTDCGAAFRSQAFQTVCADLGITAQRAIGGIPELRSHIERAFQTISVNLMPELAGRTFSNIAEKGDSKPADQACLTENDLAFVLVRWVVDIYHNLAHRGLGGETPAKCWERLSSKYGVMNPPDIKTCRIVFGESIRRKLDKQGLLVLGIRYHSEALAHWLTRHHDLDLEVRWLPSDISAILVRLDKDWVTVPAVISGLENTTAQLWSMAVREVRASDPQRDCFGEAVMLAALRDIRARTENARAAEGLLVNEWTEKRLRAAEEELMIGFHVGAEPRPKKLATGRGQSMLDGVGDLDPTTGDLRISPASQGKRSGKFKLGE